MVDRKTLCAGLNRHLLTINHSPSTSEIGGSPRIRTEFSPVKSRDFTIKVCNLVTVRKDRDTKAELNRRGQICEVLIATGISHRGKRKPKRTESGVRPLLRPCGGLYRRTRFTWEMDGHEGSAPSTPVWKTGVCLSTPMPGEMESRAGIAPASAVLQTAA